MKPACPKCRLFYTIKRTGYNWEEGMPKSGDGKTVPYVWGSYKLWAGDLFECRGCGAQVIVGVPHRPIAEHYQAEYLDRVAEINPQVRIDDC